MLLVVMVGISGSGKSTFVKQHYPDGVIGSADHGMLDAEGKYVFDVKKLASAHASCVRTIIGELEQQTPVIVVDNTSLRLVEIAPYVALGDAFAAKVEINILRIDPDIAWARNVHGVPHDKVLQQYKTLQKTVLELPHFWPVRFWEWETYEKNYSQR